MGLRPIKRNEDAVGRSSGINGLDRVFNGAAKKWWVTFTVKTLQPNLTTPETVSCAMLSRKRYCESVRRSAPGPGPPATTPGIA
jgi:hypothetical protein